MFLVKYFFLIRIQDVTILIEKEFFCACSKITRFGASANGLVICPAEPVVCQKKEKNVGDMIICRQKTEGNG